MPEGSSIKDIPIFLFYLEKQLNRQKEVSVLKLLKEMIYHKIIDKVKLEKEFSKIFKQPH